MVATSCNAMQCKHIGRYTQQSSAYLKHSDSSLAGKSLIIVLAAPFEA